MLVIYLFNLTGYRLLFNYYINKSNRQITLLADNNRYFDSELALIKIKLNLPYMKDWADYERYDGSVSINGIQYNYIKRKIAQDTLYLLCLANELTAKLSKEKIDYAGKANDMPSGHNNTPSAKKYVFLNEFRQPVLNYFFLKPAIHARDMFFNTSAAIIKSYQADTAGEPPELKA